MNWYKHATQNQIAKCELHTKFSYWYYYLCFLFLFLFLFPFVAVVSSLFFIVLNFSTAMFINVPSLPFAMLHSLHIWFEHSWGGLSTVLSNSSYFLYCRKKNNIFLFLCSLLTNKSNIHRTNKQKMKTMK